jgi:hypothetical protein
MLYRADMPPPGLKSTAEEERPGGSIVERLRAPCDEMVLETYKKITRLRCLTNCGLCGTTRHATLPYWSLGMRVCKYCMQANLVSHAVLDEKYWLNIWAGGGQWPDGKKNFVEAVVGKVFFFREYATARQRLEFTDDPLDFRQHNHKTPTVSWFFWRPHLEQILEFGKLEQAAREKRRASEVVRALVRRALTLRTLNGGSRAHTRLIQWSWRVDRRGALHKLRKAQVLEKAPRFDKMSATIDLNRKLAAFEDRVLPPPSRKFELVASPIDPA